MRLNFTGRRKIDKQHARVVFHDDPVGSKRGHYFELALTLAPYSLPAEAGVFVEATRGPTLMRFDFGTVGEVAQLSAEQRRLSDFTTGPEGVKFRVKVTQLTGPEAGKLLAEADGIRPEEEGVTPLIYLAGDGEMGQTPWRLDLVPTDPDLPTLYIHMDLGGKEYAKDPVAKPLLMTAAAREVFGVLVSTEIDEDDDEHWSTLWARFATQVLALNSPTEADAWSGDEKREWVEQAVNAFAAKQELMGGLKRYKADLELQDLEEIN
jgi:hypothetical protein